MPGRRPHVGNGELFGKISCTSEIQAAFILSSFVTFFSGLAILFIFRLVWKCIKSRHRKKEKEILNLISSRTNLLRRLYFYGVFRDRIEMLLSAQTFVGQVFVILVFVLSIGSLIIYFINSNDPVGSCSSYDDITIPIDLIFNAFFSFYFGLRFLAAGDKIKFWLEMNSIVDIFTIPPTFISYYLKSNWLGLRFLRALRLLELPQILQILQAIKTSNSVKLSKLLAIILSTWFTAAGFIHLVENSGDPWLKDRNSQNISYFESIYLVVATTSTVGFGDVVPKTSLGRAFIMFFTLGSLVLFANYVPEMVELFANKKKFTRSYQVVKGKKFIVVCGNITVDSVTAFLRNFLRHRAGEINTEIVFLGEAPPSLELETIFKCYLAYTTFVSGSALKWEDLSRAAVEFAEACLIIANPLCSDSHSEDTANIMRVLSIKNYYPNTRVIIQILHSHNKVFLPKIPSWNWSAGDNIICFAELKLGFIAQGCSVPGLCTLLTSLFVEQNKKVTPKCPWQKYFLSGLKNKILTQRLSDDFAGMSFPEVSRLCFVKMNLMLIAIEYRSTFRSGYCGLILNPPAQIKLLKNTLGFFIAESLNEVKRAFFYCSSCHRDVYTPELITKCGCKNKNRQHLQGPGLVVMKRNMKDYSTVQLLDSSTREGSRFTLSSTTRSLLSCKILAAPGRYIQLPDKTPGSFYLKDLGAELHLQIRAEETRLEAPVLLKALPPPLGLGAALLKGRVVCMVKLSFLPEVAIHIPDPPFTQPGSGASALLQRKADIIFLQRVPFQKAEKFERLELSTSKSKERDTQDSVSFESFQYSTNMEDTDQLDSTGMYHWCKSTPLDQVILKRSLKYEFRNHIVACVFGDAHSTLMGLRNFVIPLRASNYTQQELKDIVFIGSLDYLQREWRFIRNFPQIYILPGSALYTGDLHIVNIEDCSMCAILAPSPKPCSSPTLVDTEAIMATLNIGSLRVISTTQESTTGIEGANLGFLYRTPQFPVQCFQVHINTPLAPQQREGISSELNEFSERRFRRVPILTELKNPSNIHFIEQLGGLEGTLTGTSLHLSTSFATGAVFSGSFLDSLLATAFYNYHVLELLHMLVTGGISFQLEQHLDKEKFSGIPENTTFLSGRMRCKMGLLSLDQTILSDIQPRRTFGQLFCGSLDQFGILCIGLYRMIDDEENNPEHRRGVCWPGKFVITRPSIQFKLMPSDLVFCAIPFSTDCDKKDGDVSKIPPSYEIINVAPLTPETPLDLDRSATTDLMEEKPLHMFCPQVYPLEPSSSQVSESPQAEPGEKQLGENVKGNGKQNIPKEGAVLTPT
ncbi:potassium channel subfamily U member 1 [Perognathus longimembris pacificus]|uniref:potassium channel subfamily U member 1 n=1 Tax=Perognathus longimembris pacificus TaxID=214514 RepID=UPI0020197FFF|nr:potassium channel subfamily U member 1 [Perognathus longimembris pacificus]